MHHNFMPLSYIHSQKITRGAAMHQQLRNFNSSKLSKFICDRKAVVHSHEALYRDTVKQDVFNHYYEL